jgi:cytochrome c biogenesis protein CcmG/thiol:disulfide interchange protein DsbE
MKWLPVFLSIILATFRLMAQVETFSGTNLRDLDGNLVSMSAVVEPGHPLVMVFWKSGNSRCCENLETIQSAWMKNLKEKGVNFIAICEDCSGSWAHVKPIVKANEWDFDVFIDVNGDLKRALCVTAIPSTLLFGSDMFLICRHPGWCSGNEELLCEKILGHLDAMDSPVPLE